MTPKRAMLLVALLGLAACAVEVGGPAEELSYYDASGDMVYAPEPPPPRAEAIVGAAPTSSHVWVGGYWARTRTGWKWVHGGWVARPRPGVVWIPGHWERRTGGYVWVSGYWR